MVVSYFLDTSCNFIFVSVLLGECQSVQEQLCALWYKCISLVIYNRCRDYCNRLMPVANHLMFTHKQNLEDDGLALTTVATQSYQAKCSRQIAEFHSY